MIKINKLLEYVYNNSEMGLYATSELLKMLNEKENSIKKTILEEQKEYEHFVDITKKYIKKNNLDCKTTGMMAKMGAKMGINTEVMKDNSDAAIAHMLIEGFTMGIVDIETKIKNYDSDSDKEVLKYANDYLKFQKSEINNLKKYL